MTDPYADDAERAHRLSRRIGRFMERWRGMIRSRPWLNTVYKVLVTTLGIAIVVLGLVLVPLPGPGWLIVFIGLTVLGTEYHWARRLLGWLRRALARFWERWNLWRAARRARAEERDREREAARAAREAAAAEREGFRDASGFGHPGARGGDLV